jgi:myo-inositol-1(or 4)-monophosphatase
LRAAEAASERAALVAELVAAVQEAGALALRYVGSQLKTWTKAKNSPVSEVDIAVDALLRGRLAALAPDYGWLSEESEDDPARLVARRVWIVDPIDGTRAFLAGRTDWAISAALTEAGRPILAALFAPAERETLVAVAGAGATCNGERIIVRAGERLAGALVAGPQSHLKRLAALDPQIVPAPKVYSLALRLARVAQGRLDAAFAAGSGYDWDLAAADLLVHEAQGALTTIAGGSLTYNRPEPTHGALVAAGRSRHRTLIDLLRTRQAEFR